MIHPKVLIIGQVLDKKNGSGITLSNLFKGWPKDRLAVATNIFLDGHVDFSTCEIYYQLGYNSKQHPFPLNIFHSKINCGPIKRKLNNTENENKPVHQSRKSFGFQKIHSFIDSMLTFFGIYHYVYKLSVTEDFKDWLVGYNPDIIYSQLSTLELIRFVEKIQSITKKPTAIHIMDDWPSTIGKTGLFKSYWKRKINIELRNLIDKSSVLMSISDAMSQEYKTRYNRDFISFHNPVEINHWIPLARKEWNNNNLFKILYTGRIGTANGQSIIMMANVIDYINSNGIKMNLDIFTPDVNSNDSIFLTNLKGVELKSPMPHSSMPSLLARYDLLFLPLDFEDEAIVFSQFSMPTKVSEYMISGTPVLVFANRRTALAKYAIDYNWAYTVTENKKELLIEALNELYLNPVLRQTLAERAKNIAVKNENAEIVRAKFKTALDQQRSS